MKLHLDEYKDKLLGCWMGKNIGGTLGEPYEGRRGVFNLEFYSQETHGEPLPNDDLDLQLIWLNAVEKFGNRVNAAILAEYWTIYNVCHNSEYGVAKNNLRMGLAPPLSGYVDNAFQNSNGSFIRSEIWACLAPGNPEIAAKYAYEDAIVDHCGEGVYAEVFLAALESAAFVETDKYKLIDIGLSYISDSANIAYAVRLAVSLSQSGKTWQEARTEIMTLLPSDYGTPVDRSAIEVFPPAQIGNHAPNNIALMITGWLHGEDDFGKSICIAVNCGEDTDCTAASLGSILGIIKGIKGIPSRWTEPVGRDIKTICINLVDEGIIVPKTIDELTDRIILQTPLFLGTKICDVLSPGAGYSINVGPSDKLYMTESKINHYMWKSFLDIVKQSPFCIRNEFVLFSTVLESDSDPFIASGSQKKFKLTVENTVFNNQWISLKWHVPEGLRIFPENSVCLPLQQYHGYMAKVDLGFTLECGELHDSLYDLLLEISSIGHITKGIIPVRLIHKPAAH